MQFSNAVSTRLRKELSKRSQAQEWATHSVLAPARSTTPGKNSTIVSNRLLAPSTTCASHFHRRQRADWAVLWHYSSATS